MPFVVVLLFLALASPAPGVDLRERQLREMERTMHVLVNADRKAHNLPPLEWDEELSAVARAHSLDMMTNDRFSHKSPTTGNAADRIFKAGLGASATAENLAKDFAVETAQQGLMRSPGHRANILSDAYDRLGVGVVEGLGYLWFTQNFRKVLHVADVRKQTQALFNAMNKARREAGVPDLVPSRALMEIARDVANRQNAAQTLFGDLPAKLVRERGIQYRSFWAFTGLDMTTDSALQMKQLLSADINKVGIALVQNRSQEKGLGMLWMVVLLSNIP